MVTRCIGNAQKTPISTLRLITVRAKCPVTVLAILKAFHHGGSIPPARFDAKSFSRSGLTASIVPRVSKTVGRYVGSKATERSVPGLFRT